MGRLFCENYSPPPAVIRGLDPLIHRPGSGHLHKTRSKRTDCRVTPGAKTASRLSRQRRVRSLRSLLRAQFAIIDIVFALKLGTTWRTSFAMLSFNCRHNFDILSLRATSQHARFGRQKVSKNFTKLTVKALPDWKTFRRFHPCLRYARR